MILVFLRGWVAVTLVAANTIHLARGQWLYAAIGGWLISYVWYWNAGTAGSHPQDRVRQIVYATGAMLGTLTGMAVGRWLTGTSTD